MPGLSFIYPSALWLLLLLVPLWALTLVVPRRLAPWRFWSSLAIRSLLILVLVLAMAGAQFVTDVHHLTTVFLLDSSDSISPSVRGQAEAFVQESLRTMPSGDEAALVVFGDNALVERAPSPEQAIGRLNSLPVVARTDIEEAVQLGLALLPADSQKRLVLLSDGGENTGSAITAARLAAARGVPIDIVDLSGKPGDAEVLVAGLDAPSRMREGQEVTLVASVESSVAQPARLRLFNDQQVLVDQNVNLNPGSNRFSFTVPADGQGFRRYRVQVEAGQDGRVQNNEAAALVQVQGPPRVLLVEGAPDEAAALKNALQAANIAAETTRPADLPGDLAGLSAFDTIVLVNVPARALPVKTMAALPAYVRDLGKGLVMIGGQESYGVGGYGKTPVEEALPVYMDVRDRQERPDLALVFVVDKSGSMDACHCSGPNRRTAQFQQDGERKVDIAKEAVVQASALLGPQDTLGVVAFDDSAHWVLSPTRGATANQVADAISAVEPRGSTNIRAGLQAAQEMLGKTDARIKHVILLTDGWGHGGDNLDIAQQMRDQGVTLTVVAAGSGSADYLSQLAQSGGGRYYPAQDMTEVPQIFLQETITAVGNYIVEQPFFPAIAADSPVLSGFASGLPQLYGYNGTTIKETSKRLLVASDGSPVLAAWQYGLGRSIAWTSDAKAKWARDWVTWDQFPRFASQMVGWVLPTRGAQGVTTDMRVVGARTEINVAVEGENGKPREDATLMATLIGSEGTRQEVPLQQVAPGQYRGSLASPIAGTYLVQIAGTAAGRAVVQEVAGLVVPYSPEYRPDQANPTLLNTLREMTGGAALRAEDAAAAFAPTGERVRRAQEIALPLLLLALLLLPLDIAVRRLLLRRNDFAGVGVLASRLGRSAPPAAVNDPTLERLAQAKRRAAQAEHRQPRADSSRQPAESNQQPATGSQPGQEAGSPQSTIHNPQSEDPLERLREAKERARRRARGEE